MRIVQAGRLAVREADGPADLEACFRLRHLAFRGGEGLDHDAIDARCRHLMVEDREGTLLCCFRLLALRGGAEIGRSYSAQHYDLGALAAFEGPMVELGRFCVRPGAADPDILRLAWAAMARVVDDEGARLLFGCSSFRGVEVEAHREAFALLKARHLAPRRWRPLVKAAEVFRFASRLRRPPDLKVATRTMPPLLRTYLIMGGWVSDHAVIDRELGTMHVFTGLEIAAIPPARGRALRAVAG